jgi:hypothetical protein
LRLAADAQVHRLVQHSGDAAVAQCRAGVAAGEEAVGGLTDVALSDGEVQDRGFVLTDRVLVVDLIGDGDFST